MYLKIHIPTIRYNFNQFFENNLESISSLKYYESKKLIDANLEI